MEEEDEINKEIIKRVNDVWEKQLKEPFSDFMNQKQEEILNELEKKFDDLIKKNINKIYEDDKILRKKEIDFQNLKEPNLVYLSFLQNTNPLINMVLQCLSNIKEVSFYYLNPPKEERILKKSKNDPNNTYLGPSFLTLLDHLWKSQQKEYAPLEIHNVLKKLMIDNYNTNDASIIINFILNKLDAELNLNENNNIEQDDPYEHNEKDKIYKFSKKFNDNRTQISDTFFSLIKIMKKCPNCYLKDEYYFEATPSINIYLTESNEINCEHPEAQKLNLEENFKTLLIEKEEIYTISVVLIIVINRDHDPNYTRYFKYPEKIDLEKIINNNNNNNFKSKNYELRAVIKKTKNNNNNNFKYTAFFKNCIDNKWYLYNNQKIMLIQSNYENYVFDEKNAYVLIYCMPI